LKLGFVAPTGEDAAAVANFATTAAKKPGFATHLLPEDENVPSNAIIASQKLQSMHGNKNGGALLGAGGAAAAVLAAVELWEDSEVRVFNRTASASADLVASFSSIATHCNEPAPAMARATLVVNATSVGLADIASPVDPALLPGSAAVLDLVYRPGETQFVREARGRGLNAADGREMLLEQGALAFVQWFGCEPNKTVMRHALEQAMITG
jgi:shikimate dehydrogenase